MSASGRGAQPSRAQRRALIRATAEQLEVLGQLWDNEADLVPTSTPFFFVVVVVVV